MADRTVNIDQTLKGWIAYYLDVAQTSFGDASKNANFGRDTGGDLTVITYRSDQHKWEDLPKYGCIAVKTFCLPPETGGELITLVYNGFSQYCPYNEPSDLADCTSNIKWGLMIEDYTEFKDIIEAARLDSTEVLTMLD